MTEHDNTLVEEFVSGAHPEYIGYSGPSPLLQPPPPPHPSSPLGKYHSYHPRIAKSTPPRTSEMAESALRRLHEIFKEAKHLCSCLRFAGYHKEVEGALGELFSGDTTTSAWDGREVASDVYADSWGGKDEGAATVFPGEEMEAAASTAGSGTSSFNLMPDRNAYQKPLNEQLRIQPAEKGGGSVSVGQSIPMQNAAKSIPKGKGKKSMTVSGNEVNPDGEDNPWKQAANPKQGAWPNNPAENPNPDGVTLAFVEFKRGRIRKYASVPNIPPGRYVIVDGDRGQDCGLLVQTIRKIPGEDDQIVCMEGSNVDENSKLEQGRVIRQATEDEVRRLHSVIASAEALALKTCRERCNELNIDIVLVDVEYQFDMNKVSFFFDSERSVDFRSLVRELYRTFGARIWMENINPKVRNSMPEAAHNGAGNHGSAENSNWHGHKKKNR